MPEAAQSLPTRSADGKSYTFTIRRGFRFSPPSNESVTAQTFKYTIERTLTPRMRSPLAPEFRDIVGASAYMAGKATHISGVVAHRNALTIRLTAPGSRHPRADRDADLVRGADEHSDRSRAACERSRPPAHTASPTTRPTRGSCSRATPTTTATGPTGWRGS